MISPLKKYGLFVILISLIIIFGFLNPSFLSIPNLLNILSQNSIIGIVSIGMTLVVIVGGIDLSVGSIVAFCSIVFATSVVEGFGVLLASFITILAGGFIGLLNGFSTAHGKIPSFIVTLGMMSVARGLALMLSGGRSIPLGSVDLNSVLNTSIIGFDLSSILFVILSIIMWAFLNKTFPGKYLFAIGGNKKAAHFNGIKVNQYTIIVFTLCGLASAIGAILLVGSLNSAQPQAGVLYELTAIAAVVIGGADLSGGKGSVVGTFLGVLILGIINNGLSIMNVPAYYQYILVGLIVVFSVLFNNNFKIMRYEKL